MKKFAQLILLFFIFSSSFAVLADTEIDIDNLEKMAAQLKKVNKKLARGLFEEDSLSEWTKLTIKMKSSASLCVSNTETALLNLKEVMDGLGDKVKGEDSDVTKKRHNYQKKKDGLDKILAKCNLFIVSSEETGKLISHAEKSYFKQKFLAKTPDIVDLLDAYLNNPVGIVKNSGQFLLKSSGINDIKLTDMAVSILFVLISIGVGIWFRKKLLLLESRRQWQDDFAENFARATLTTLACSLPYILGALIAAVASVIVTSSPDETPFITQLFVGLLAFFIATTVIRLLLSPYPPAKVFLPFTPGIAGRLARRFRVLAVLSLIGYLAFYTVFSESIVENNLLLLRNIFSMIVIINIVWTLQLVVASPKFPKLRYVLLLVILLLVLSLIAEWMGYRNIAFTSRRVVMVLFITFLLFIGISRLLRDLFNAFDEGSYAWCRKVHKVLGVEKGEKVPGLIWIRFLTTVMVWGSFAYIFISALDYSGGVIEQVKNYLINGFDLGGFRIIPSRILWAVLVFGMVIIFSSWIRSQLENNWLKLTMMEQGARDAVVTIIGYVMFLIAVMAGLSAAGFDFGNIAIIAGALSVGIGFGLQNIVNNFVSGLILLFERPIRKGDWIEVGGTEGVVKDIHIRSTRIQTFDRSDVIVPNSELISNQVTNWVLSTRSGRAIIPVGVAYGTDIEQVRDILMNIAENNSDVVKSGFMPSPKVLFREFGDSSLNFELRVFLHQIDGRLGVISDINFAIDKAFKEAGIEIPFPQRDLHVKTLPDDFVRKSRIENDVQEDRSRDDRNE